PTTPAARREPRPPIPRTSAATNHYRVLRTRYWVLLLISTPRPAPSPLVPRLDTPRRQKYRGAARRSPTSARPPAERSRLMSAKHAVGVPLCDLQAQLRELRPELEAAAARVLVSGQVILGPEVAALEEEVARYCGANFGVGCASGTDA